MISLTVRLVYILGQVMTGQDQMRIEISWGGTWVGWKFYLEGFNSIFFEENIKLSCVSYHMVESHTGSINWSYNKWRHQCTTMYQYLLNQETIRGKRITSNFFLQMYVQSTAQQYNSVQYVAVVQYSLYSMTNSTKYSTVLRNNWLPHPNFWPLCHSWRLMRVTDTGKYAVTP